MKFAITGLMFSLMVGPAFACGLHGTNAAADINSWLNTQVDPDSTVGLPQVEGGQSRTNADGESVAFHVGDTEADEHVGDEFNDEGGDLNGWGNENYWVNIELPTGETVTVNASSDNWDRFGDGGAGVENFLVSEGQKAILEWFQDYDPGNTAGEPFIG